MREKQVYNQDQNSRLMQTLLEMGDRLLDAGAEINRVEDTLTRLGMAYGAARMNVFVIISNIIITMELPDGTLLTHTRRVSYDGSTNFNALEQLNSLSRECCRHPLPLEEFERRLAGCSRTKRRRNLYLGGILAAGSFAMFFGGSPVDGIAAAAVGLLITLFQEKCQGFFGNNVMFNLVCSFVTGLIICLTVRIFPFLHTDKIMIGDIMLLIPGIAITNSLRDMLMGDTISGLMRLIESILWAGALAAGFMAAMWIPGMQGDSLGTAGLYSGLTAIVLQLAMAALGSVGYAVLFGLRRNLWFPAALGGLICWGSYLLAEAGSRNIFLAGLTASLLATFYSEILAIVKKAPVTVFVIPGVVSLIPGSSLYYMMSAAVRGLGEETAYYGSLTLQYALSIAAGISIVWTVFSILRGNWRNRPAS